MGWVDWMDVMDVMDGMGWVQGGLLGWCGACPIFLFGWSGEGRAEKSWAGQVCPPMYRKEA